MQNDKTDETKIGKDGDKNAVLCKVRLGKVELDIREFTPKSSVDGKTNENEIGEDGDKNAVLGKVELDIREGIGMYNADDNENFE